MGRPSAELRRRMSMIGVCHAGVVLVWNFLSVCIAGSIEMSEEYNLDGAGFVSLILELLLVWAALLLAVCSFTRWSKRNEVTELNEVSRSETIGKPQSNNSVVAPTLLTEAADRKSDRDLESSGQANTLKTAWSEHATAS